MGMRESLSELRKWIWTIPTVILLALLGSWIAGQCRDWRTPKPPPTVPAQIDPGVPSPGQTNEAPAVESELTVAVPALTKEQVLAELARFGLVAVEQGAAGERSKPQGLLESEQGTEAALPAGSAPETPLNASVYPAKLADETFKHEATGVEIAVAAFLLRQGDRVQLAGIWQEYQPPAPPVCPPSSGGWFGNEARWVKSVGVGYGVGRNGSGLAGRGSIDYLGPRTGAVTWGAGLSGIYVNSADGGDYAAVATFNLTF